MRQILLTLLIIVTYNRAFTQETIHVGFLPGFLMPHSVSMPHMAAHSIGGEIAFQFQGLGNKHIDSLYKNADWGVLFYYNYLGKHALNGSTLGVIPYFQVRIKKHKYSETMMRLSAGIGYCTQIFNSVNNLKNRAMSSKLNGTMQFFLLNYRQYSSNATFFYGIGMSHLSNANFKRPNLGLNTPQINFGINFSTPVKRTLRFHSDTTLPQTKTYLETRIGFALKTATVSDPTMRPVYTLSLTQGLGITPIRGARFGLDFYYDKLDPYIVFTPDSKQSFPFSDAFEAAVKAGYEYYLRNVNIYADLGYYAYKPEQVGKLKYYISIGINYHYKKFFIGTRLKSHAANADFIDWCVGYRFDTNYKKVK
ncbi:MAG: acyloxyacyl hydrolase [Bacteroidia bacterium]|nr:acyloxyacyl hydrolase [Bacteroidia bacterium]